MNWAQNNAARKDEFRNPPELGWEYLIRLEDGHLWKEQVRAI